MVPGDTTTSPKKHKGASSARDSIDGNDTELFFPRDVDLDQTPTRHSNAALYTSFRPRASRSASRSPTKSRSTSGFSDRQSNASSSARRKFIELPLKEEGIVKRELSDALTDQDAPAAIRSMLQKIRSLERCRGVLCQSRRDDPSFVPLMRDADLDDAVYAVSKDHPASRLTAANAQEIVADARRCFLMDHDESVWNADVHNMLLRMVLRPATGRQARLGEFSLCTTAPIIKDYLPEGEAEKKVDFCMYINPSADPDVSLQSKIVALRRALPETSLNHTSYVALCPYPISVSLETKRPGHDLNGAILQIGIWQATHWKMLRRLLGWTAPERLRRQGRASASPEDIDALVNDELAKLGALHGVLIQGHDWSYVATSPESLDGPAKAHSLKTVLWLQKSFGHTSTELGVHQVAAFLEQLNTWSTQVYWPWFKRCFLE
ncbi:uncharacterized protein GLRG_11622 [Colletotrichum graminicola M1.001]|uniref:PD-(D/E)XK nuclease-like domain-containing protein n=1 Tax=Colletotrichum graminicola (strain M1.001 / M2 / FGSC 10212) TaxID=645133 RepID=E3R039_COLGM|nr:uncharacterized protein GLRG_11622 [Colletotrichum graminicola M1.001]EFQ36477.1 hypothetical protein GLRG_11622 [Colletotrichum graminicola M1.001]